MPCHRISDKMPFISVIVPSYNESKFIRFCMESLINLNYPQDKFEIIVVDNGSTDDTVSICSEYTPKIYVAPDLTVGGLRNFGARKANGQIYAFIDADCVADSSWLINAINSLKNEEYIIGSKYNIPSDARWIEKVWFSQKPKGKTEVTYINSGNMILPKNLFNEIGGFNESIRTGEDYDLCLRAKKKLKKTISDDTIKVIHLGNPKTLGSFLKREIWHGLGSFSSFKNKWIDLPLFGTIFFFTFSMFQFFGVLTIPFANTANIFLLSTIGLAILLISTAVYRINYVKNPKEFLQLMILYYVYYLGRSIALFYIFTRRNYFGYVLTKEKPQANIGPVASNHPPAEPGALKFMSRSKRQQSR